MKRTALKRKGRKPRKPKPVSVGQLLMLWSLAVRKRAGFRCENCEAERTLQAHHIFPRGSVRYAHLRFDLDNGVCLCWSCHLGPNGVHKDAMQWGIRMEEILENRGQDFSELVMRANNPPEVSPIDRAALKVVFEAIAAA